MAPFVNIFDVSFPFRINFNIVERTFSLYYVSAVYYCTWLSFDRKYESKHIVGRPTKKKGELAPSKPNYFVIPPNSNTFPDWRRTCHVPLVKTQWRSRANKTQWRPRETTTLNFGLACDQVVHLETAGNLCTGQPDVKSHWSRKFLIRDGIHYSRKGIYSRKNISCRLTKGKISTFCVSKLVVWRQKWVAHVRQLARWPWSPGRKVFV